MTQRIEWTPEREAILVAEYRSGLTADEIARDWTRRYRVDITRSLIAGKLNRLGEYRDPWQERQTRCRIAKQAHPPRPRPPGSPPPIPKPKRPRRPIPLIAFTDHTCRWPVEFHKRKGWLFCGTPDADVADGRPYCREHSRIAYA